MSSSQMDHLSAAEIAAAHIPPHNLSATEKAAADATLLQLRMDKLRTMTESQRILASLVQLKFQMEDYVQSQGDPQEGGFSAFLQQYMQVLNKKQVVFAKEISLHPTKLNQILRGRTNPNLPLVYRLEKHAAGQIPAVLWWKVFAKKLEYQIGADKIGRQKEAAKVKYVVQLT